jgi:hypothetical protein
MLDIYALVIAFLERPLPMNERFVWFVPVNSP